MIIPAEIMKLAPTIGSAAVLVYAVLAQHADEDGVCWPSVRRMAEIAGMSTSTVRRSLKALVGHALITVEIRNDKTGQSSNVYQLPTTQEPPIKNDRGGLSNLPHPPVKSTTPPCQKRKGPPVKNVRGTRTNELDPLNKNQGTKSKLKYSDDFDAWWAIYPRKVGKAKAFTAWKSATKEKTTAELLEITKRFAKSPSGNAGQFTPHPTTWLSQARYEDDPQEWEKERTNGKGTVAASGRVRQRKWDGFE